MQAGNKRIEQTGDEKLESGRKQERMQGMILYRSICSIRTFRIQDQSSGWIN